MKKRWTAALLTLALAAALLPVPAQAAAAADRSAGSRLTGADREVYTYLKEEIIKIAKGARTNTEVRIPDLKSLSWPVAELGASGNGQADVLAKLKERLAQSLDMDRVYKCLAADLPYEMFWMDNRYAWGSSLSREGNTASVKSVTVRLYVSRDYQGGSTSTSPSKIAAANRAAENARDIVDRHRDKSDQEKLAAYREEICRLTAYNTGAAGGGAPYGDPWQLVYVFDGDPNTNVVCEGYAKAFKYLCDLSEFDGNVVCRTVTGTMGDGGHMWNVVQMGDGKNYLVDVTNCDSGTIGADDRLFLTGAERAEDGSYTVSKGYCRAVYTYDEHMEELYGAARLALSDADYVPGFDLPAPPQESPAAETFTDVGADAYYAGPVAWAVEAGITNGTTQTTFSPAQPCTHGQILTFLWRAAGRPEPSVENPFTDVTASHYYYQAALWAYENGLVEGDVFGASELCSRSMAVTYLWRLDGAPLGAVPVFVDIPWDAPYVQAVAWAVRTGVTSGSGGSNFAPLEICSRSQIVTFLHRYMAGK